jgi:hypothetical protein
MLMPKAAVHKQSHAPAPKDDIGFSRQVSRVKTISQTRSMKRLADAHFWLGVARSNA